MMPILALSGVAALLATGVVSVLIGRAAMANAPAAMTTTSGLWAGDLGNFFFAAPAVTSFGSGAVCLSS